MVVALTLALGITALSIALLPTAPADPIARTAAPVSPATTVPATIATGPLATAAPPVLNRRAPLADVIASIDTATLLAANPSATAESLSELAADPSVWVDEQARLLYQDTMEMPTAASGPTPEAAAAAVTAQAVAPLDQTFELQSRPGSKHTIYLDVRGGAVTNTMWNKNNDTIRVPAWDRDGSPTTFDDYERELLQQIWAIVAEDYAPFDVNVTLKDLGSDAILKTGPADDTFGMVARITNDRITNVCASACAGIAYVDVFTRGDAATRPAWVFAQGAPAVYIAQTISHEVGHTFGLHHDGSTDGSAYYSGQGIWSPIMGGGRTLPIAQWSIGDYAGANQTEDDVAIIASHGAPLLTDEAGSGFLTARTIDPTIPYRGVITSRTDVDTFAINAPAGPLHLQVDPALHGPNLDLKVRLFNASGTQLASNDPASGDLHPNSGDFIATGLGAAIDHTLPVAQKVFLKVEGVGRGDRLTTGYSDYGSLGAYTISTTNPRLTVDVRGAGRVSAPTPAINCTTSCSATATMNATITLTATPTPGSALAFWVGPCDSANATSEPTPNPTCTIRLDQSRAAVAVFRPMRMVTVAVTGGGYVSASIPDIECGLKDGLPATRCSVSDWHPRITLQAHPGPGRSVVAWGGACSGTAATCVVRMNTARSVTITFS